MIYTVTLNPALDRELTVPELSQDTVLRASASRADAGGKGFNVSKSIAALGGNSIALGFAGGKTGELLQEKLTIDGIPTEFIWIDDETRTNTSIISESTGSYIKANESGPEISAEKLAQLITQVERLAKAGDYWVLAGSLPRNVPETIYQTLITRIQAAGAFAILDASGPALRHGLAAQPYLVKPNDEEALALTGHANLEDAIATMLTLGAQIIVISKGKNGALLVNSEHRVHVNSPSITQRNPIGAGDAMVGGLVYSLATGDPLAAALQLAVSCGAAAASKYGTAFGSRAEIDALREQTFSKE